MPIRFRCPQCRGLMSISTRRIGATVACPTCRSDVVVPDRDTFDLPGEVPPVPLPPLPETPTPPPVLERAEQLVPVARPTRPAVGSAPSDAPDDASSGNFDLQAADEDPTFSRPPSRFEEDDLDLTAMVDVVFQLLIFFMVTASFSLQKTMEVPTPDQPKKGVAQALQPLEDPQDVAILVDIDDRNAITVDDEPLADLSLLPDKLRELMRRDQKSELILTAARNSTHRAVIAVVDAANEVGMQRIRMATGGPSAEP